MFFLKTLGAILVLVLSVGCASTGDHQTAITGDKEIAKAIFDRPVVRLDRSVIRSSLIEGTVRETDVAQVALVGADGKPRPIYDPRTGTFVLVLQMVDSYITNPIGRDLLNSTAPLLTNSYLITSSQERIAKMCAHGNCPGGSGGAGSQSVAGAANENKVNIHVNVGAGPACAKTGTCVPVGD